MTALDIRPLPELPRRYRHPALDQWELPLEGCEPVRAAHPRTQPAEDRMQAHAVAAVQVIVEVMGGYRPLSQLLPWTTERVHAEVGQRLRALAGVQVSSTRHQVPRARVATVHVSRPAEDSAEVTARFVQGDRSRALAVRMEVRDDRRHEPRWTCTAVRWG